jgi:Protein kinase domain
VTQLKICPQCGAEYELDQRFCPKDGTTLRMQGGEHELVGSIIADRYHVLRKLGEGGMGQVYLAEHVKMGRRSAVKVMNPRMVHDADAISRFNREAANASRINHPNVAAVYDFGETGDGLIYLAMEFVEGLPLTRLIQQQGALPPLRAADIARQTAGALAVAHDMGIVHRDLKPDNIMVAKNRDGSDLVKVVDFGIAKAANNEAQQVTGTGLVVGTPEYMSPEQMAGDKLDGRSDVYSLALVTFNMLTGALPFPGESAQDAMIMRLTDKPKPLAEAKPDVVWTREVQAVMDRALERDADLRYQTAAEFGRDLYRAVAAMPRSAAAEAGTQVIGAAPPPRPAASAAIPATRVAATADASSAKSATTPSGKSKAPLIAAVVTVAVLGGGTALMMEMRKPAAPIDARPAATHGAADSAGANPAGIADHQPGAPIASPATRGTEELRKPGATAPPLTNPARGTLNGARVDTALARLDIAASATDLDPRGATAILRSLDSLSGNLGTPSQKVSAAIIRVNAEEVRGNHDTACQILRQIEPLALTTSKASIVTGALAFCK